jgi:hypothetical protein
MSSTGLRKPVWPVINECRPFVTSALVRQALGRHREDPPCGASMVLPIHHQMDEDFCSAVTQDLRTHGAHWERRLATETLWQQLPAETGIYMFVFTSTLSLQMAGHASNTFSPAWVLYVGRAGSPDSHRTIRDRYKGEYCKYVGADPEILWSEHYPTTRAERLARFLAIHPLQFWYATILDRTKIPILEDRLIKLLGPLINSRQQPRLRALPAEAAFRSVP